MRSAFGESLKVLLPLVALFLLSPLLPHPAGALFGGVVVAAVVFTMYFFRDPYRIVPQEAGAIVSAADGVVVAVDELEHPLVDGGRMKRVAVFLSVFDVHINRMPFAGTVKRVVHTAGKFLDVRLPEAALVNERADWLVETEHGPLVVRQIAGLVARRIVCWSGEGAQLATGERMGMIRFGSRTEVFLPKSCTVVVKPGQRVYGGSTVIAQWTVGGESSR